MLAGKGIFMIAFNLAAAPKAQGESESFRFAELQNSAFIILYSGMFCNRYLK